MRVLITGSSGQIGTNLALRLLAAGHEVFGVDKRINGWTDAFRYLLQDLSGQYQAFPTGIGGVEYPPADIVVHLAAHAKVHQLVQQPRRALENMQMTFNVLEYCRQTGTPIIFSSSREVYGDVHRFTTEETHADFAFTESTYSASKIASEALIYSYSRCYGLPYLVFRFSNVYGRYDNDIDRMERVIPLFIRRIARDEPITVYGAEKVLDFTYIDDCIDGIVRGIHALSSGLVKNETINLAFGEGHSLGEMAELVGRALGVPPRISYAPPLLGEVTHYVANIQKAHDLLGYTPEVSLSEGIRRAVTWTQAWAMLHPETNPTTPEAALPVRDDEESNPVVQVGAGAGPLPPLGYKYNSPDLLPYRPGQAAVLSQFLPDVEDEEAAPPEAPPHPEAGSLHEYQPGEAEILADLFAPDPAAPEPDKAALMAEPDKAALLAELFSPPGEGSEEEKS
jgi:UDP-glucose 4-epimerase